MIEELWQTHKDIEKVVEEYFKYEPKPFLLIKPKKPFPEVLQLVQVWECLAESCHPR